MAQPRCHPFSVMRVASGKQVGRGPTAIRCHQPLVFTRALCAGKSACAQICLRGALLVSLCFLRTKICGYPSGVASCSGKEWSAYPPLTPSPVRSVPPAPLPSSWHLLHDAFSESVPHHIVLGGSGLTYVAWIFPLVGECYGDRCLRFHMPVKASSFSARPATSRRRRPFRRYSTSTCPLREARADALACDRWGSQHRVGGE